MNRRIGMYIFQFSVLKTIDFVDSIDIIIRTIYINCQIFIFINRDSIL